MKKVIILSAVLSFCFLGISNAEAAITVTPNPIGAPWLAANIPTITCAYGGDVQVLIFFPDGTNFTSFTGDACGINPFFTTFEQWTNITPTTQGNWHFVLWNNAGDPSALTYPDILTDPDYGGVDVTWVVDASSVPPPASPASISGLIDTSSTTIANALGVTPAQTVTWAGAMGVNYVFGSLLGTLGLLLPIALFIVVAGLVFAFLDKKLMKHLRKK